MTDLSQPSFSNGVTGHGRLRRPSVKSPEMRRQNLDFRLEANFFKASGSTRFLADHAGFYQSTIGVSMIRSNDNKRSSGKSFNAEATQTGEAPHFIGSVVVQRPTLEAIVEHFFKKDLQ